MVHHKRSIAYLENAIDSYDQFHGIPLGSVTQPEYIGLAERTANSDIWTKRLGKLKCLFSWSLANLRLLSTPTVYDFY